MTANGDGGQGALQHAGVDDGGQGDADDHGTNYHVKYDGPGLEPSGSFFFLRYGLPLGRGGASRLLLAELLVARCTHD